MTSDGTNCYTYNDANQLSKVTNCNSGQTVAQYVYDYQGNRIEKKVYNNNSLQQTVYTPNKDYQTVKLASNGATLNTSYYYVNDELAAQKNPDGSKYYFLSDNLGSTSVLTNQSGNVVENTTYLPYGQIQSGGTDSKYLYTGQQNDQETNLDYYNARYYDPSIQHFTQPDSELPNVYDPQQLNRYAYVRDNPMTETDPTGHALWDEAATILLENPVTGSLLSRIPVVNSVLNFVAGTEDEPAAQDTEEQVVNKVQSVGNNTEDNQGLSATENNEGISTDLGNSESSGFKSYNSFNELKKDLGSAGQGNNWHHIVEQSKIGEFGAEDIHNTDNVVNIPAQVNFNINGYYSSVQPFTQGQTVRQWLSGQSYEEQFNFGQQILNQKIGEYNNQ